MESAPRVDAQTWCDLVSVPEAVPLIGLAGRFSVGVRR
jgi:hypothetical protein